MYLYLFSNVVINVQGSPNPTWVRRENLGIISNTYYSNAVETKLEVRVGAIKIYQRAIAVSFELARTWPF